MFSGSKNHRFDGTHKISPLEMGPASFSNPAQERHVVFTLTLQNNSYRRVDWAHQTALNLTVEGGHSSPYTKNQASTAGHIRHYRSTIDLSLYLQGLINTSIIIYATAGNILLDRFENTVLTALKRAFEID
jgi:hypothetical protein